jgi:dienelactone hydrolase
MAIFYRAFSIFSAFFIAFFVWVATGFAQNQSSLGVVLLHDKAGTPNGSIAKLANALRDKGYEVLTPSMPWASGLIYSAGYDESLKLIGAEVQSLREKGVKNIVVAGHSMGGHMALAYAAMDPDLAGVVLLAPSHYPETYAYVWKPVIDSLELAKNLTARGWYAEKNYFNDLDERKEMTVFAKPADYLSFCDPEGPSQLSNAVVSFRHSLPVLIISEKNPRLDPKTAIFDRLPKNNKNRFIQSKADHSNVPNETISDVLSWLKFLDIP